MKIILEDFYAKGHYVASYETNIQRIKNIEDLPEDLIKEIEQRIKRHLRNTLGGSVNKKRTNSL